MRITELIAYVNDSMPQGYISYYLNWAPLRSNKKIKALKRAIKKRKKDEVKRVEEDIDIFGDD